MVELVQGIGRVLFYFCLPGVMLWRPRWFFFWLPFTPMCGLWMETFQLGQGSSNLSSFMETALVIILLSAWIQRPDKSRFSLALLGLPLLALPSFLNAEGHVFFSLFFFIGLLAAPAVFDLWLDQLPKLTEGNHLDRMVILWNVLTLLTRAYEMATTGGLFLQERGGGIWASNHYGGIMLLLLPMVQSPYVAALTLAVLSIQFSRGIYLAMVIFGLAWGFSIRWRPVVRTLGLMIAAMTVTWVVLPFSQKQLIKMMVVERFAFEGMHLANVTAETVLERASKDDRVAIHATAWQLADQSGQMGVGLGGFYFGMQRQGGDMWFSNAHNLYLTALAEGGVGYAGAVCALIAWAILISYRHNKKAFCGLLAWAVYGTYSGELYEAARFASCMDYYYFLLLLAWIVVSSPQLLERFGPPRLTGGGR